MEIVKPTSEKDPEAKIRELLVEIGVDPEEIAPRIMARLVLLNESTETINDGKSSIKTARSIFGYYEREKPDKTFSDIEKKTVLVGTFFSDIGKTGPANATLDQQKLIIEMYRVENVVDTAMSVRDFLKTYFSDVEERVKRFQGMGLDPDMTMRSFWNLHSKWTLEIVSGDGVPAEAIAGAAAHHMLEGVNPEDIVGADGRFTRYFGHNPSFDRAEKLIIVLDKYDAVKRRSRRTAKEAIEYVKERVSSNPRFADDEEFKVLLDDLERIQEFEAA